MTFIQGTQVASGSSSVSSETLSFASNVTIGDLIVVFYSYNLTSSTATITDTNSNVTTWTVAKDYTAASLTCRQGIVYGFATSTGACSPKITLSAASSFVRFIIHEYSGSWTFDVANATDVGSGTGSVNLTTATANELVVGYAVSNNGTTAGTGFTLRETCGAEITEDGTFTASGANTIIAGDAGAGSEWSMVAAAFSGSGGGGGTLHTSSVSGTSTFTGGQTKQVNKLLIA